MARQFKLSGSSVIKLIKFDRLFINVHDLKNVLIDDKGLCSLFLLMRAIARVCIHTRIERLMRAKELMYQLTVSYCVYERKISQLTYTAKVN